MKKICVLALCLAFLLTLSACKKSNDSSSAISSSSTSSIASSSASQSTATASSTPSSAPSSAPSATTMPSSLITVISTQGEPIVVEIKAPMQWDANATTVFIENEKKIMEIVAVAKIKDKAAPFAFEDAEFFTKTPEDLPADLGHIEKRELTILGNKAELHIWKTYPADGEALWYPHYYFVQNGDYAFVIAFYPMSEDYKSDEAMYEQILSTILVLE